MKLDNVLEQMKYNELAKKIGQVTNQTNAKMMIEFLESIIEIIKKNEKDLAVQRKGMVGK